MQKKKKKNLKFKVEYIYPSFYPYEHIRFILLLRRGESKRSIVLINFLFQLAKDRS